MAVVLLAFLGLNEFTKAAKTRRNLFHLFCATRLTLANEQEKELKAFMQPSRDKGAMNQAGGGLDSALETKEFCSQRRCQ
uniref:Secreted protein n=1 Tax=Panagrellus redivivus TaxID=6233 RepID=A0A7E4UZX1_PANRE